MGPSVEEEEENPKYNVEFEMGSMVVIAREDGGCIPPPRPKIIFS